jgi:signal transduction histidine kinase
VAGGGEVVPLSVTRGRVGAWYWHLTFAGLAAVATTIAVAGDEVHGVQRLVPVGVIAALCCWYAVTGRTVAAERSPRRRLVYLVGASVLTLALFTTLPAGSLMTLLLFPQIWTLLPARRAALATVVTGGTGLMFLLYLGLSRMAVSAALGAMTGVLILALGLGAWIGTVVAQNRRRALLVAELRATRAELAAASRDAGSLAERDRLAGEIHDTLAQGFTSILLLLQAVQGELVTDPPAADRHLRQAQQTARDNLAEARTLVAVLTPPSLESGSLAEALRRLVDRFGREATVRAGFTVAGTPRPVPMTAQLVLLRAAQEALANVRKHAAATIVQVCLSHGDGTVGLAIRDDGRGFDPGGQAVGFGLDGMRRRVQEIGGRLAVDSARDAGTTLTVEVPAG